jgi:Ca-activated chloride channel family protein
MLELAWPWVAAALALPWIVARLAPPAAPLGAPLRVPFLAAARRWQANEGVRTRARSALALAAWALLVAAACRPQWLGAPVAAPASGRSMLLALDVSGSMSDPVPGGGLTFDVMIRSARRFIAQRTGDRVGLIVFGSKAYVQAPLTFDLDAVEKMVDEAFIGLAGEGTAIGDAIALATARLRAIPRDSRVLVLITDGSNTEGALSVDEATRLARAYGVRVYAIGIGVPGTAARQPGMGLDEPVLERVAAETGGRYFRAGDRAALQRVVAEIDRAEPAAKDTRRVRPSRELYAWPLGTAILLALAALAAGTRRTAERGRA